MCVKFHEFKMIIRIRKNISEVDIYGLNKERHASKNVLFQLCMCTIILINKMKETVIACSTIKYLTHCMLVDFGTLHCFNKIFTCFVFLSANTKAVKLLHVSILINYIINFRIRGTKKD